MAMTGPPVGWLAVTSSSDKCLRRTKVQATSHKPTRCAQTPSFRCLLPCGGY